MNRSILVSIDFSIDSGNGNSKNPTDAKKVNKDNAQAGLPAKRDFFTFFSKIVSFKFLFLCGITV